MTASILAKRSLLIVFAYAPAGLGHLRVTDALYHGLPTGATPVLLGAQDKSVGTIHRIMSIHPFLRHLMEWAQRGLPEEIFTSLYRLNLRTTTTILYQQMATLLSQRIEVPTTVLIIATHFGLAHKLAAIKEKLEKELKVKVILAVCVTDDSPQHIWYVAGADVIFVPSLNTKLELQQYAARGNLAAVDIQVLPYPVSPLLAKPLTPASFANRQRQTDYRSQATIHVAVPISGAAVGTEFTRDLIDELYQRSHRFTFHVICKSVPFTERFIHDMLNRPFVKLYVSTHDREVVSQYELLYKRETIGFEITKPSEQAFKALLSTTSIGGSLLLFSKPVGRQEYDNINFLTRHRLIPTKKQQDMLVNAVYPTNSGLRLIHGLAKAERVADSSFMGIQAENIKQLHNRNTMFAWRSLLLPNHPREAAVFFIRCLQTGIFTSMLSHNEANMRVTNGEVRSDGVNIFWQKVTEIVSGNSMNG